MKIDSNLADWAITETSRKHHETTVDRLKALNILESMRSSLLASYSRPKYERLTFRELRDDAIKRHEVRGEASKKAYQSLIGFYFGSKKAEVEEVPPPIPIVVKKNGQLAWDYEQMLQVGA